MAMSTLEIVAQIADLKEVDYKNTLALATLIELLIEKGLFTRQEFARKAAELDGATLGEIILRRQQLLHGQPLRRSTATQLGASE